VSRGDALGRLRSALEDHGSVIRGNNAQCPAHDDRQASLSIGQGRDGAVLNCHAGCGTDMVLEPLGLSAADLYDEPREPGNGAGFQVVTTYTYTDEAGVPLFCAERRMPKDFRQYHIADGRKVWNLKGVRRVLYRLPRVIQAVKDGETIYVCEGEKDVNAIEAAGAVATCNPMGAGKWRPEFGDTLTGARVVIVADADETGRNHAAAVKHHLDGKAGSVTVVEPAEGKDAYDHLAAGHSLTELLPTACEDTHNGDPLAWAHIIDWHEAFGAKPAEVDWLIEPLLERGTGNAWFGKPGACKSLIALEVAAALAAGRPVLGAPAAGPMTVVYVDVENSVNDIAERLQAFSYQPGDLKRLVCSSFPDLPALDTPGGGQRLLALTEARGAALVIIDTTSRIIAGKENDADTFLQLYRNALIPLKQRGITVLRLDHPGKDTERGQRGSSAKDGDVDTVWLVDRVSDTAVNFERRKSRSGHGFPALYLTRRFEPLRHEPGGTGMPPRVAGILAALTPLNAPTDISQRGAAKLLRDAGEHFRNDELAKALRIWREHPGNAGNTQPGQVFPDPPPRSGGSGNGPPPDHGTGSCARCRKPCNRYGDGGRPLCDDCSEPQP
jgi:hypothetical protein